MMQTTISLLILTGIMYVIYALFFRRVANDAATTQQNLISREQHHAPVEHSPEILEDNHQELSLRIEQKLLLLEQLIHEARLETEQLEEFLTQAHHQEAQTRHAA